MLSRKTPDYLVQYDFKQEEGKKFIVRTDKRNPDNVIIYEGNVSANISTINYTLQILRDDKPVDSYDGHSNPWELKITSKGKHHSNFGSPYFKRLPENESIYLKNSLDRHLNTEIVTTEIQEYSQLTFHFVN